MTALDLSLASGGWSAGGGGTSTTESRGLWTSTRAKCTPSSCCLERREQPGLTTPHSAAAMYSVSAIDNSSCPVYPPSLPLAAAHRRTPNKAMLEEARTTHNTRNVNKSAKLTGVVVRSECVHSLCGDAPYNRRSKETRRCCGCQRCTEAIEHETAAVRKKSGVSDCGDWRAVAAIRCRIRFTPLARSNRMPQIIFLQTLTFRNRVMAARYPLPGHAAAVPRTGETLRRAVHRNVAHT